MRFAGQTAIVTGAASGLGRATASRLAREGARVVLADVSTEDGAKLAAELSSTGHTAHFCSLDVRSETDWRAAVEWATANYGAPAVLINNAGLSGTAFDDVLDEEGWTRLMDVNAKGAFLGTRVLIPIMQKQQHGAIVNVSSVSAIIGQKNVHVGYNASKAALRLLTKSIAVHFGKDGIRCNSVHPGLMPPMRTTRPNPDPAPRDRLLERIPLGRAATLDEIVNPIVFLASPEASYITGADVYVDGGFLAG
jgi:NAD(P)-dependent dehydrogenase (short-subunit alcohol dehydrogenase family)